MTNMEPNEELLSAYLDGELDGDAREQVEERLQTDAEFRRCYYDFRAIRESIQQLPQLKLGPDFSANVLARIEAKALEQQQDTANVDSSPPVKTDSPIKADARRGWLPWAIGALAASFLIGLILPALITGPGRVAMGPATDSRAAKAPATKAPAAASDLREINGDDWQSEAALAEGAITKETDDDVRDEPTMSLEMSAGSSAYNFKDRNELPTLEEQVPAQPEAASPAPVGLADSQNAHRRMGRKLQTSVDSLRESRQSPPVLRTDAPSAEPTSAVPSSQFRMAEATAEDKSDADTTVTDVQALYFYDNTQKTPIAGKLDVALESVDFQADSKGFSEEQLLNLLNSTEMQNRFVKNQAPTSYRLAQRTLTENYTVMVPQQTTRQENYTVPQETRAREQGVTEMVPELRTRTVPYTVQVPYTEGETTTPGRNSGKEASRVDQVEFPVLDPMQAASHLANRLSPVRPMAQKSNSVERQVLNQQQFDDEELTATNEQANLNRSKSRADSKGASALGATVVESLATADQRYVVVTATVEAAATLFHNLDPIANSQVSLAAVSKRGQDLQTNYFSIANQFPTTGGRRAFGGGAASTVDGGAVAGGSIISGGVISGSVVSDGVKSEGIVSAGKAVEGSDPKANANPQSNPNRSKIKASSNAVSKDAVPDDAVPDDTIPDTPVLDNPVLDNPVLDNPVLDNPVLDNPVLDDTVSKRPVPDAEAVGDESDDSAKVRGIGPSNSAAPADTADTNDGVANLDRYSDSELPLKKAGDKSKLASPNGESLTAPNKKFEKQLAQSSATQLDELARNGEFVRILFVFPNDAENESGTSQNEANATP